MISVRNNPDLRHPIKLWVNSIEGDALRQATHAANHPATAMPVSLMADAHTGFGVPIGCVWATENAVVPNAVGVDIGCGVLAWNTGLTLDQFEWHKLMEYLEAHVPVGKGMYGNRIPIESAFAFSSMQSEFSDLVDQTNIYGKKEESGRDRFCKQLGTLGGGNHFIELQTDENDIVWIMVHSGSRGFGAAVNKYFDTKARELCKMWHSKALDWTNDLAFLPIESDEGKQYIEFHDLAIHYAYKNRFVMAAWARRFFDEAGLRDQMTDLGDAINIHHNYVALENHNGRNVYVHRKGATLAREGTIGAIPGSMTTKSYIVRGKGSKDSLMSCSHGSGRNFSRTEAKRRVESGEAPSQQDQLQQAGVALYGHKEVHDELGHAYKAIEDVMSNQSDLVDILHTLTPIAVLKGD